MGRFFFFVFFFFSLPFLEGRIPVGAQSVCLFVCLFVSILVEPRNYCWEEFCQPFSLGQK